MIEHMRSRLTASSQHHLAKAFSLYSRYASITWMPNPIKKLDKRRRGNISNRLSSYLCIGQLDGFRHYWKQHDSTIAPVFLVYLSNGCQIPPLRALTDTKTDTVAFYIFLFSPKHAFMIRAQTRLFSDDCLRSP
jgi:hypothetical protein